MNKQIIYLAALLLLVVGFAACEKGTQDSTTDFFPAVQVNTSVNITLPQYNNLNLIQGYVYLPDGYKGVVLFRTASDEFVAFDRACPYKTDSSCSQIAVDSSNLYYRCGHVINNRWQPCCDSRFDASSGIVLRGPAGRGLRQYYTRRTENIIYVSSVPF